MVSLWSSLFGPLFLRLLEPFKIDPGWLTESSMYTVQSTFFKWQMRGRGSSVGRVRDFWWGSSGFVPRCGSPLPTGCVGVSIKLMWPAKTEVIVSPLCFVCGGTWTCQTSVLGLVRLYSLVVDEDVKKPTNQPTMWQMTSGKEDVLSRNSVFAYKANMWMIWIIRRGEQVNWMHTMKWHQVASSQEKLCSFS